MRRLGFGFALCLTQNNSREMPREITPSQAECSEVETHCCEREVHFVKSLVIHDRTVYRQSPTG